MSAKIPAHIREQQINDLPNISFVRWDGEYRNSSSKAVCRCAVDGFEWAAAVSSLISGGRGCPQCGGVRRWTAEERIRQINAKPNTIFIRWADVYKNVHSKAVCRCEVDGYEWAAEVQSLVNDGTGCPQCGTLRVTAGKRIAQINALPNIRFVRWADGYRNNRSKAICRCDLDGHEWVSEVNNLVNAGSGCPKCAPYGFDPSKRGTLYLLRSDCGSMVKIGISNDHEQRHSQLKRATPFDWSCIELLHGDGEAIADMEKELHSITEQAAFSQPFDGYTEWRKWDPRLLKWVDRYRTRLARYNKAP